MGFWVTYCVPLWVGGGMRRVGMALSCPPSVPIHELFGPVGTIMPLRFAPPPYVSCCYGGFRAKRVGSATKRKKIISVKIRAIRGSLLVFFTFPE